jgi:hypothetical protein
MCSPMRGRPSRGGVDRNDGLEVTPDAPLVAPNAGAWIETAMNRVLAGGRRVAPDAGRGSKQRPCLRSKSCSGRPHAGAWIETSNASRRICSLDFCPLGGAWIETSRRTLTQRSRRCRPSSGRLDQEKGRRRLDGAAVPLRQERRSKRRFAAPEDDTGVAPLECWVETLT